MRILLTGASGQLGAYLLESLSLREDFEIIGWSGRHREMRGALALEPVDLTNPEALEQALEAANPDAILHAGAVSSADAVRRDPAHAWSVNVGASTQIARWCRARDRRLLFTSTDLVFDGRGSWYREEDPAHPLLAYGRSKREAEQAVMADAPNALVARLSLLYGPSHCGRESFFDHEFTALKAGLARSYFIDEFRTPLDYRTASRILVRLLKVDYRGTLHVGGPERLSRHALMARSAAAMRIDPALIHGNRQQDAAMAEPRPADVSLDTERLAQILPDLDRPSVEAAITAMP